MKPQTYLRLSLLLPYILWGIALLLVAVFGGFEGSFVDDEMTIPLVLAWLVSIYLVGIIFWFIPYTLLAAGLWIWSINKQARTTLRVFAASPLILTVLIIIEISIFTFDPQSISFLPSAPDFENFWGFNGIAALLTLAVGYFCVGIGFAIYKLLQKLEIIKEPGTEIQSLAAEAG
jgi:hypothetical protein